MRSLGLVAFAFLLSGCFIIFDGAGDDDKDCPLVEPTAPPQAQRNPDTLRCETFGGPYCDDRCGVCPEATSPVTAIPPLPSWGVCGDPCEQLGQEACAADPACRVVLDAGCAIQGNCLTDFIGCYPTDTATDTSIDCFTADAWQCSRNNECTAMHSAWTCLDEACPQAFALCVPEGSYPGTCWDEVACRAEPPSCPSGTTPGIANACYTGACIPLALCGPQP